MNTSPTVETLRPGSGDGITVGLLALGAGIRSITIPLASGDVNAVLGYPGTNAYRDDRQYMGVTLGRFANRIANAEFRLDGRRHRLSATPGAAGHCLHGGAEGFNRRTWQIVERSGSETVSFRLLSPDGDQGFPGNLEAVVTYTLVDAWRLRIGFRATSDAPTVVNLANHAYFTLHGDAIPADQHRLTIHADAYTPVDAGLVPTGEIRNVTGTPFDFRRGALIHSRLAMDDPQLRICRGFDHNFVLTGAAGTLRPAASLVSPRSGVRLDIRTTQPGVQLYTGQYLEPPFRPGAGLCLETQGFPDAPNQSGFPGTLLRPGETMEHVTEFAFSLT